jgi:ComEC/Rec2-related protein
MNLYSEGIPYLATICLTAFVDLRISSVLVVLKVLFNRQLSKIVVTAVMIMLATTHYQSNYVNWLTNMPLGSQSVAAEIIESKINRFAQRLVVKAVDGHKFVTDVPKYPSLSVNQSVIISGSIRHVDRNNQYEQSYFSEGISGVIEHAALVNYETAEVKDSACARIIVTYVYEFANILCGVTVGHYQISEDSAELFKSMGLTHILSVSGYNVTLLVGLLGKLAGRLNRRHLYWLIPLTLILYLQVVGSENVPASRAVLMAVFMTIAQNFGRRSTTWLSLLYANVALFIFNPYVYQSVSWQLSITALLGILLLTDTLSAKLTIVPALFRTELAVSLAASIATAPVLITHFGQLSLISPLANLVVSPFIPILMIIACIAFVLSLVPALAALFLYLVEPVYETLLYVLAQINEYQIHSVLVFSLICMIAFVHHKYVYKN